MATILIVDDRRDAELVLGSLLKAKGFSVRTLSDPTLLEETLQSGGIDAILMDLNMPEMDGCEATQLIKANESLRNIPIVICTAHPLEGDEQRARDSGCDGFLEKPVESELLTALLTSLLSTEPISNATSIEEIGIEELNESKRPDLNSTDLALQ